MTIDIALLELYNKVKDDPNSTQEQLDATNTVVGWINDNKKSHLENHKLFSKLYVIYFGHLVTHFQDIEFAQKEIHKQLSENVQCHAFWLREKINILEFQKWSKSVGLSQKDYNFMSEEELKERNAILQQHQGAFLRNTNKWSHEQINTSINNQISEAINKFSNYD